jgi:hypothetical protein
VEFSIHPLRGATVTTTPSCGKWNDGWEFSTGCTFEYLVAFTEGLPTFDAEAAPLDLESATARVAAALAVLHGDGLDAHALAGYLSHLQELTSTRFARGPAEPG